MFRLLKRLYFTRLGKNGICNWNIQDQQYDWWKKSDTYDEIEHHMLIFYFRHEVLANGQCVVLYVPWTTFRMNTFFPCMYCTNGCTWPHCSDARGDIKHMMTGKNKLHLAQYLCEKSGLPTLISFLSIQLDMHSLKRNSKIFEPQCPLNPTMP